MATYTVNDLVAEVQNKLGDTSFPTADLITYADNINKYIHNTYQLRYMQGSQDYTTTATVQALGTLPADFQVAYNLRILDKSYASKLAHLTFDQFDTLFPQPTLQAPSIPQYWYTFSNTVNLFPAPSTPSGITQSPGVYTLELRYLKVPTTLTTSGQSPDVPESFRQLMSLGMLKLAMEKRQRFDVGQYYDAQFQELLVSFLDRYSIGSFQESDPYIIPDPLSSRF